MRSVGRPLEASTKDLDGLVVLPGLHEELTVELMGRLDRSGGSGRRILLLFELDSLGQVLQG